MPYEIDYIPVGDGEKGGDAIALRFGNLTGTPNQQTVIVIDGGFKETGEKLVEHIKNYYKTSRVDIVICTHPDADHASGLSVVLRDLNVGQLAMHLPWKNVGEIKTLFENNRISAIGLKRTIEASLQNANDLEALAISKGIPIIEPFQGVNGFNGALHILGPSQEYYNNLVANFRSTPEPKQAASIFTPVRKMAEEAAKRIRDFLHIDLLDDDTDSTSAENNSSVITFFNIDGHKLLFTGDAGKTALHLAADYAQSKGIVLSDLHFLDVPHHGSKRNLSSKVLKKIIAPTAFVSAPTNSEKHPAKKVTNALRKHGAKVFVTKGQTIHHHHEAPDRPGWVALTEEPFHDVVEE